MLTFHTSEYCGYISSLCNVGHWIIWHSLELVSDTFQSYTSHPMALLPEKEWVRESISLVCLYFNGVHCFDAIGDNAK
jgi:hypothetical protein